MTQKIVVVAIVLAILVGLVALTLRATGHIEIMRLQAQAASDDAAAKRELAEGKRILAEGEKILAAGEAVAIRAPAEAAAKALNRQSWIMTYYGLLTPVVVVALIVSAMVAGLLCGVLIAPTWRVWWEMRRVNYDGGKNE